APPPQTARGSRRTGTPPGGARARPSGRSRPRPTTRGDRLRGTSEPSHRKGAAMISRRRAALVLAALLVAGRATPLAAEAAAKGFVAAPPEAVGLSPERLARPAAAGQRAADGGPGAGVRAP